MNFSRKKTKVRSFTYTKGPALRIMVNQKPLSFYEPVALQSKALSEVINTIPSGTYHIRIKGGGVGSFKEVVAKQLYTCLSQKNKNMLKVKYVELTKTDTRRVQPKKAGGKARARTQKSYR